MTENCYWVLRQHRQDDVNPSGDEDFTHDAFVALKQTVGATSPGVLSGSDAEAGEPTVMLTAVVIETSVYEAMRVADRWFDRAIETARGVTGTWAPPTRIEAILLTDGEPPTIEQGTPA